MGQVIQMPLSFFLEEDSNGNIAMSNLIGKVDEASKLLAPGVVIELDNGVRCSSRDELLLAISQANSAGKYVANNHHADQAESNIKEQVQSSSSNVALWAILIVLVVFIILFIVVFDGGF